MTAGNRPARRANPFGGAAGPRAAVPPLLRRGLIALTMVGIAAAAFELYSEQHWNTSIQLIPWGALAVLLLATLIALLPGGRGTVVVRVLAVLVLGASAFGVVEHVLTNYAAGPLDPAHRDTWAGLPLVQRVWLAATKAVGTSPTLAPGVLGQTALLLLLATVTGSGSGRHSFRR